MTLPTDWWSGINTQMGTLMGWTALSTPTQVVVGAAVVMITVSLFMAVFLHR